MSEALYDEKIAPMLAEVSKLCQQHDLPMFAVVEYEPGHYGETACQTPKQSLAMSMTHMASRARGNLDAFVISLLRFCKKQGISTDASMVANRMTGTCGVTPCDEAQQEYEPVGDFIARPQPDGEPLWERAADWSAEKVTLYRKRPSGVAGMAARPTDAQIEWRMELFDLLTKWYEAPSASTAKQDAWIAICRHVPPGTTPPALASGVMGMEEPKNG